MKTVIQKLREPQPEKRRTGLWALDRHSAIATAALLTAGIAIADWQIVPDVSISLFYFFPILIAAGYLRFWELIGFTLACTALSEQFSGEHWGGDPVPRLITTFAAYMGVGFLVREIQMHRVNTSNLNRELTEEMDLRERSEAQLRALVDGSPAAILTIDEEGKIVLANASAHEVLRSQEQPLPGQSVDAYLPELAKIRQTSGIRDVVRTLIECTGYRYGGEAFLANVWVASFGRAPASSLIAIVFDASEQLRTTEEMGLHTLARSARVVLGGFWHEIRNLCTSMRVVSANLKRLPHVAESEHFEALQTLIESLEKLSGVGLHPEAEDEPEITSLRAVLDHLRIVMEPAFQEAEIGVRWHLAEHLPLVKADQHGLLQIFLNLTRNAVRALEQSERKELVVSATVEKRRVVVRFLNTGKPVPHPELLFQPFQPAASDSGMGLYVSRALVRSFGGDLRYEGLPGGSCFAVELDATTVVL